MKHGISIWDWYVGNKPTSVPICLFVWVLHLILGIEARGFWMVFYEYLPARLIQTWKKKKSFIPPLLRNISVNFCCRLLSMSEWMLLFSLSLSLSLYFILFIYYFFLVLVWHVGFFFSLSHNTFHKIFFGFILLLFVCFFIYLLLFE